MTESTNQISKEADEKFCNDCGVAIKAKAEICSKCGVKQSPTPVSGATTVKGKNKIAAALLAFFLGGIGVHRFYLGQVGLGLVYLLFFWTGIPAIVSLVEFILLLLMSDDDFNKKYNAT